MSVQYRKLAGEVFQHLIEYVSTRLGDRIFDLLGRDYPRVRKHGTAEDRRDAIARVRTRVMASIAAAGGMAKIEEQFGLYVGGAISKILHDRENTLGLAVVSQRHPEGWTAYGDAKLETPDNETNLRYMTEAVQASKQNLWPTRKRDVPPSPLNIGWIALQTRDAYVDYALSRTTQALNVSLARVIHGTSAWARRKFQRLYLATVATTVGVVIAALTILFELISW